MILITKRLFSLFTLLAAANFALAQNPLIRDQFTADPSARVFDGKLYVYPSHDIYCEENDGREDWFCMKDYHVFSSEDMMHWTDHGKIIDQDEVPWVDATTNSMWAPDCIEKDGKYYFYFPTKNKDKSTNGDRSSIGVAIADTPIGPFEPEAVPIAGVQGIDPNVFIDEEGQAYLYWSENKIYGAKLSDDMLELASEPRIFTELPQKGLIEGPFVFEREGVYYMTYPHVANETERLEYATSNHPLGPFEHQGVLMDESPTGCWTNHHSIVNYQNQWYLFYHHNDYSPDFDKNRAIRADSLFFDDNGAIQKVIPTLRGVGITAAKDQIQIDRYSHLSETGAEIEFIDPDNTFEGWKVVLSANDAWVQYNAVDFGNGNLQNVSIKAAAAAEGETLEIRLNDINGPIVSSIQLNKNASFITYEADLLQKLSGIQDLILVYKGKQSVAIDWLTFE